MPQHKSSFWLRLLLAAMLACSPIVASASDIGSSNYSETDGSNNQAPPAGWPTGMQPNQVEPSARAMMGAVKRWFNHIQPTVTSAGSANVQTLTYGVAPAAYVSGDIYRFVVGAALTTTTTTPTLNVNSLGAVTLVSANASALVGGELQAGYDVSVRYDGTNFRIISPPPPASTGAPGAAPPPRSYLSGCTLSVAGGSGTWNVSACYSADSTNTVTMNGAALAKTTSNWTLGNNGGSLDTGAISPSTWYHAFEIMRSDTGVVDYLVSTSATSPTLPTSYTYFRRLGSMRTDASSHWIAFTQRGDIFGWVTPIADVADTTITTSLKNYTLTVPTGVIVEVLLGMEFTNSVTAGAAAGLFGADSTGASAVGGNNAVINATAGAFVFMNYRLITNTSAQIQAEASLVANNSVFVYNNGWVDRRGRDN